MAGWSYTMRKYYIDNKELGDKTMQAKSITPFLLKSFIIAKLFGLSLFATSCSDDDDMGIDGHQYVTFTVSTPYATTPTYAISDNSESAVKSIDVLAFGLTNGEERYVYRASGTEINDKGSSTKKEFKVSLRKDEDLDYRFVIIANAAAELDAMTLSPSVVKNSLLAYLLAKNGADKWNAASDTDFKALPMWGETKTLMKITNNVKSITDIDLLRSVVAINVAVGPVAQTDFKLDEVYLYNRKTRGRVVPIAANFSQAEVKVTKPSMPTDNPADPLTILEGLKYTSSSDIKLENTIYTFEASGVDKNDDLKATCVVVGGRYKGQLTYYRLDFAETESDGTFKAFMHLLRNHKYTFNITNVTDNGYDTPDDAFYGKKVGISVDIEAWNMSDMAEVVVDKEYYLKVSKGSFDIVSSEVYKGMVTVQTDHPNGWDVSTPDNSWITLTKSSSTHFNFTLSALSSGSREGIITIKVGNLKKTIKIRQIAS